MMKPDESADGFSKILPFSYYPPDLETISCPLCQSDSARVIHARPPFKVVLCEGCGLSYLNPRLRQSVMRSTYEGNGYFSDIADAGYRDYVSQEKSLRITFRRFLTELKLLGLTSGSLLEVGCGYGYFLDEARDFFPSVSGTELSPDAADRARKSSVANVHAGDIDSLPPEWSNFDVIVAINVIEHIYAPVEFLIAAKQRLKGGGKAVIATPDFGSFWVKVLGSRWPSFKIPEHVTFYTKKTLGLLLEKAGFSNIREVPFQHFFPLGLIAGKFGLSIRGGVGLLPVRLPKTMIALSARK